MGSPEIQVQVGQYWRHPRGACSWQITKVENSQCWAIEEGQPLSSAELWGDLAKDGTPDGWGAYEYIGMSMLPDKHPIPPYKPEGRTKEADPDVEATVAFFYRVVPGNCACNIPRSQCDYHG
jgi:hypothetical protein